MLSTDEFKLKYGNIVRKEHKVALNQLTKILNRDQTNADIMGPTLKHSASMTESSNSLRFCQILPTKAQNTSNPTVCMPSSVALYSFCSNIMMKSEERDLRHPRKGIVARYRDENATLTYALVAYKPV